MRLLDLVVWLVTAILVGAISFTFAWILTGLFVDAVRTGGPREAWTYLKPFILWWRKP